MAGQSPIETQVTIKMTSRAKFQLVTFAILALIAVAEFATLMSGQKPSTCNNLEVNPKCSIKDCSHFAEIQCGNVILNLTAEELGQFSNLACGSELLNVSCSFTKQEDVSHLYHFEYSAEECGAICQFFRD